MTLYSISNPYPVILSLAGSGLNGGAVYIGQPNQDPQTFPVTVYWDAGGSDVAAQPLPTIGGYITRAGTPAQVFGPTEYSIRVRDRFGVVVFYEPNASGPLADFITTLAGGGGSALVGYNLGATGAVDRTVQGRLRERASVLDFGVVADGATDDTAAFQAALDSGLDLYLTPGVMVIGAVTMSTDGQQIFGTRSCSIQHKAGITGDLISVTGDKCTLSGFDLDGNSANVTYIYGNREIVIKAADCVVSDLRMTDCSSFPIYGTKGAVRAHIIGNYIENCGDFGIFINDLNGTGADPEAGICENNTVIEFGIEGDGGIISSVGIGIRSAVGGWRVANNFVRNVTTRANEQLGIECWVDSNNVAVVGNVIDMSAANSGEYGLSITGKGCVVSSNLILGTSVYGIELNDRGATCIGNIVRSPAGSGISANLNPAIADSGDIMTITGNVVEGTTVATSGSVAGIVIDGDLSLDPIAITISGNTIHGLSTGIQCNSTTVGVTIIGNTIYNTGSVTAGITALGTDCTISGNTVVRVSTAGTGNMVSGLNISGTGHLVSDNRVSGNSRTDAGVTINSGTSATAVQGNFITGSTNTIVSASNSPTLFVLNNTGSTGLSLNAANYAEGNVNTANGSVVSQFVPTQVGSFTVANLPTTGIGVGTMLYASNGRKAGEGPGAGSGVLVFRDASNWRACDTGATVAA